jgi:hypothetical protein
MKAADQDDKPTRVNGPRPTTTGENIAVSSEPGLLAQAGVRIKRIGDTVQRFLNAIQFVLEAVVPVGQPVRRLLKALDQIVQDGTAALGKQERAESAKTKNREWKIPAAHCNFLLLLKQQLTFLDSPLQPIG